MRSILLGIALAGCRIGFDEVLEGPDAPRLITVVIEGAGAVVSEPPGIACIAPCSAVFDGPVTLTATPAGPRDVSAWGGTACSGSTCVLDGFEDQTVVVEFAGALPVANLVFTTAATFTGALDTVADVDGVAAGDRLCREAAAVAGLSGTFVSGLSSATLGLDAMTRLGSASGWVRTDGVVVFSDREAITNFLQLHSIDHDELGQLLPLGASWLGGAENGVRSSLNDCNGFSNTTGNGLSLTTHAVATDFGTRSRPCTFPSNLTCFQTDLHVGLASPAPFPIGRQAFVTLARWNGAGGVAGADAFCQTDADAAGLPGTFVAAIATSTASVADRAGGLEGPWRRPDGIVITLGSLADEIFDAPLNRDASGAPQSTELNLGAPSLVDLATTNCSDWTTVGTADLTIRADPAATRSWVQNGQIPAATCTTLRNLACLERAP